MRTLYEQIDLAANFKPKLVPSIQESVQESKTNLALEMAKRQAQPKQPEELKSLVPILPISN